MFVLKFNVPGAIYENSFLRRKLQKVCNILYTEVVQNFLRAIFDEAYAKEAAIHRSGKLAIAWRNGQFLC